MIKPRLKKLYKNVAALSAMRPSVPPAMLTVALLVIGHSAAGATLTIEQAMDIAETRGEVLAAEARATASDYKRVAISRSGYLPQLEITAFQARSNTESISTFSIPTPNGPLTQSVTFAEKNRSGLTISLNQPIVNVANWLYAVPAERANTQAAQLTEAHTRQQARAAAAEAFLDVLTLQAQHAAADAFVDSLNSRLIKLNNLVQGGRVLKSEALRVELARDNARQQSLQLDAQVQIARMELARLIGNTEMANNKLILPRIKRWPDINFNISKNQRYTVSAWETRLDLQAINAQIRALELQSRGVAAEALPTLNGQISYGRSDGISTRPDEETQVALSLNWTPFASGTRSPRRAAIAAQMNALIAERAEAKLGINVQIQQAAQEYRVATGLQQLALTATDSANATLKTRSARYDAGRANIDDVLEAEAELANQNANAAIADLQKIRSWVRWQLAIGNTPNITFYDDVQLRDYQ